MCSSHAASMANGKGRASRRSWGLGLYAKDLIKGLPIKSSRLGVCPMRANQGRALLIMIALHLSAVRSSACDTWQPAMKSDRWVREGEASSPHTDSQRSEKDG